MENLLYAPTFCFSKELSKLKGALCDPGSMYQHRKYRSGTDWLRSSSGVDIGGLDFARLCHFSRVSIFRWKNYAMNEKITLIMIVNRDSIA